MPSWKKLITSGSAASVSSITTSGDITIPATNKVYLDGGSDSYIYQSAGDIVNIYTGGENTLELSAGGADPRISFFNKDNRDRDFSFCGDTNDNVLYFDASTERVGIGTASPSTKLEIAGHTRISGVGNGLYFDTTGQTESNVITTINDYETLIGNGRGSAGFAVIGNSNIRLGFGTNYTTAETDLIINSSGNVGIGLSSPGSALHVTGSVTSNGTAAIGEFGNSGTGAIANSGHQFIIGGPSVSGYTGMIIYSDTTTGYGQISFADGRGANDSWRGTISYKHSDEYMSFWTNAAEKVRIESDGDLHGIADIIAYSSTPSDERLKDNVVTIGNSLDLVSQLRGVRFDWNIGSKKGKHDIGVIAQEVEQVIPEIVSEKKLPLLTGNDETIYKVVDYEKLTAVLIESIKELKQEIDDIKQKCDCLNK